MTFKEFTEWANDRGIDGNWKAEDVLETIVIFEEIDNKTNFFEKRKHWKESIESRAIALVDKVNKEYFDQK